MSKATVLIVDDELLVRRLLAEMLGRAGYNVELASSGVAALERLHQPGIDLLLLDLRLGEIDGVQVMEKARQIWPQLPIIMLTAHGSLASAIAAVRCGAADYLLKPINADLLRERVASVLSNYSQLRQRGQLLQSMYSQFQSILHNEGLLHEAGAHDPAHEARGLVYEAGPLQIDVDRHMVLMHGQPVEVTPSEFAILLELLSQPGAVVPCLRLTHATQTVADDEEAARQLIRPHIVRLRRKLEPNPQEPRHLISVRGVGYRWIADPVGAAVAQFVFA
ncbi:MAG TPA: response regulator transcription factor [Kouleothrix sp.]|uniref:response regulator transcription factor n=1 Tax=Kouleothrix sp. TaxID=2779161 RepID=UPI002BC68741|nr:response regulator transcription factor [Kouleothrix sp.]HRC75706.1 response regulator transcription factor [Kouleothrix sp.]